MEKQIKLKLEVNMVPTTSWGRSLRSVISKNYWDRLRKEVHEKNGNKCQLCGSTERLSCHEHWHFDPELKQQKLTGLGTICGMCHHVVHFGLSTKLAQKGHLDIQAVINHFLRVNNCTMDTFEKHLKQSAELLAERSKCSWNIDFGEYAYLVSKSAR